MNDEKDKLDTGDEIESRRAGWSFDIPGDRFEDHISRSVPHYREGHDLIARYSDFFVTPGARFYDIGSTTGALVEKLLQRHPDQSISVTGIEIIPRMVEYASKRTDDDRARFICADALEFDYEPSHLFTSYYTLQFIHPSVRVDLLRKIYNSLHWGGGLLLFEKIRAPDARFQDYSNQVYRDFKLDRGFSAEQILNKERSLKGTLEPFSEAGNLTLLREAGFTDISSIYQWVCFEGFLAIK
jgi:tRNA (cmo5U34)-methyltransferase